MCSYGISTREIIEKLAEALDDLEGDFTQKDLFAALKKLKEYPYVSDRIINDDKWQAFINREATG